MLQWKQGKTSIYYRVLMGKKDREKCRGICEWDGGNIWLQANAISLYGTMHSRQLTILELELEHATRNFSQNILLTQGKRMALLFCCSLSIYESCLHKWTTGQGNFHLTNSNLGGHQQQPLMHKFSLVGLTQDICFFFFPPLLSDSDSCICQF